MMQREGGFAGWRMVLLVAIAHSFAMGVAWSCYSAVMPTIQAEMHTTRAMAAGAVSAMILSIGLLAPLTGNLLQWITVRAAMTTGAILSAVGYVIVAYASNFTLILVVYALVIGPAACLLGPIPTSTLISRWFERDRGKALGIATMPLLTLFSPPIAALLVVQGGRQLLFLVLAAAFAAIAPLMLRIVERPQDIQQSIRRKAQLATDPAVDSAERLSNKALLVNTRFWGLSLGMGLLTGSGITYTTHAISMATLKNIDLTAASTLLSIYGAGSLAGALFFGWLIDRIGPLSSLAINAGGQAIVWLLLIASNRLLELLPLSCLVGFGIGAAVAQHGAALTAMFGSVNLPRAMGLSYCLKVPFIFGFPPLVGHFVDATGDYNSGLLFISVALAVATSIFVVMVLDERGWSGKRAGPKGSGA